MKRLVVLALVLPASLVACGGGDGSGSDAMTDEQFCEYIATIEEADFEEEPDQILAAIDAMVDRSPNKEMKGALQKLREAIVKMTSTDANNEEAFAEVMAMMFDPEMIAAGETIEKYSTEVCGFPAEGDTADGSFDDSSTDETSGVPTGYIFDDMEAGDISDAVETYLSDAGTDVSLASSGLASSGDHTDVTVDLSGGGEVDGVAVCETIEQLVTDKTTDTAYAISVTVDGTEIASRAVGGSCSSA